MRVSNSPLIQNTNMIPNDQNRPLPISKNAEKPHKSEWEAAVDACKVKKETEFKQKIDHLVAQQQSQLKITDVSPTVISVVVIINNSSGTILIINIDNIDNNSNCHASKKNQRGF